MRCQIFRARRPDRKARRPRILAIFEEGATPRGGMPRPENGDAFLIRDTRLGHVPARFSRPTTREASMRPPFRVLCILLSFAVVAAQTVLAQPVSAPVIQNVTVNADTNVITISGSGLGPDVLVTVDGQAVTLLPGATATREDTQAPAEVLTTPGMYRLTVMDPGRQTGDAFVGVSPAANVGVGAAAVSGPSAAASAKTLSPPEALAARTESTAVSRLVVGPSPLTVIEDSGFPFRTAIGYQALVS